MKTTWRLIVWRTMTKQLFAEHHAASDKMTEIASEQPRRPWHRMRLARAERLYERTLKTIPYPPIDESGNLL